MTRRVRVRGIRLAVRAIKTPAAEVRCLNPPFGECVVDKYILQFGCTKMVGLAPLFCGCATNIEGKKMPKCGEDSQKAIRMRNENETHIHSEGAPNHSQAS
jgi:hypothetical protein